MDLLDFEYLAPADKHQLAGFTVVELGWSTADLDVTPHSMNTPHGIP